MKDTVRHLQGFDTPAGLEAGVNATDATAVGAQAAASAAAASADATAPVLRVERLSAGYDRHAVIEDVSVEVPLGQWFALLGPNGSGKSTLLYCVAGMLAPLAGEIHLCGCSLASDAQAAKRALGFACAPERLPGLLTGRQCLEVYAAAKGLQSIDADVLALSEAFAFNRMLDQYVDTYSL
ncbi:MAG: ATP-binding cassette domain-containing protein, partial [Steroidobacteraceae bacterium]